MKGYVSREQTVWCWCGLNHDDPLAKRLHEERHAYLKEMIDSGKHAADWACVGYRQESGPIAPQARREGWRYTTKYGWVCPTCLRAFKRLRSSISPHIL